MVIDHADSCVQCNHWFFLLDNYADYFCKMSLQLIKSLIDKNITLKNANENNVT